MRFPSAMGCIALAATLTAAALGAEPAGAPDAAKALPTKPIATFAGHRSPVTALAFTSDGRTVSSASSDDVRTWEAATGQEQQLLKNRGGPVVAFSPDARLFALATQFPRDPEPSVDLYETTGGKRLLSIDPHGVWNPDFPFRPVIGVVAISPDGSRFATGGSQTKVGGPHGLPGGVVMTWDAKTGKPLLRFDLSTFASSLAFSADGKRLASGTDGAGGELPESGEVAVWDAASGETIQHFRTREHVEPGDVAGAVSAVGFTSDSKRVAVAVSGSRPARPAGLIPPDREQPASLFVWDLASGDLAQTVVGRDGWVGAVAFSSTGKLFATAGGSDGKLRVRDAATGKELMELPTAIALANTLAFSPNGRQLAIGGSDKNKSGLVEVWQVD